MNSHSSTLSHLVLSAETTTSGLVPVSDVPHTRHRGRVSKSTENAIYSHIRAIRALGRTEINTNEIASSLSLPVSKVNRAVSSLRKKGVKVLRVR